MFLRNGRAVVIDLSNGETVDHDMPEDMLSRELSSIEQCESLSAANDGALVLGTGLLTGSLIPAACAGILFSPEGSGHASPIMGMAGLELKLSGFDFIVIKGEASEAGYLWVRDGIAEFVPLPEMSAMDSWTRTDRIRNDQGDRRIQVIAAGPSSEAGHPASRLVTNYWLGEDEDGGALDFGRRKLCAVAFRGMGELELSDPSTHLTIASSVLKDHARLLGRSKGLASYFEGASAPHFENILHRVIGCYSCPHPCRSFIKVNEAPGMMAMGMSEPGYLHYDIPSLNAAFEAGLDSAQATATAHSCAKAGIDPVSVISSLGKDSSSLDPTSLLSQSHRFAAVTRPSLPGSFASSMQSEGEYRRFLSLGLCPRYWGRSQAGLSSISEAIESALGQPM